MQTGSAIQFWLNGSQVGSNVSATFTTNPNSRKLFGQYQNYTLYEVVFVADNTEQEKIEGYLAHKWGLSGDLPAAHPYKHAAP